MHLATLILTTNQETSKTHLQVSPFRITYEYYNNNTRLTNMTEYLNRTVWGCERDWSGGRRRNKAIGAADADG